MYAVFLAGDEEGEGVVNSGWESVQHLRRQHSSSSMTSTDFTRALKTGSLQDAAILSSNASRVHILHDAGEGWMQVRVYYLHPACC